MRISSSARWLIAAPPAPAAAPAPRPRTARRGGGPGAAGPDRGPGPRAPAEGRSLEPEQARGVVGDHGADLRLRDPLLQAELDEDPEAVDRRRAVELAVVGRQ